MEWGSSGHIAHLIATYGFLAIGVIIALESMGLPLPGETVLALAALYAAHHGHSVTPVVVSAAVGAMLGDNVGYWIGHEFGYRLLRRYGTHIGLSPNKIKLGQYLFLRHGRLYASGTRRPFDGRTRRPGRQDRPAREFSDRTRSSGAVLIATGQQPRGSPTNRVRYCQF